MKTETLEEYIDDLLKDYSGIDKAKYGLLIRVGVKWQTKRSYSKEKALELLQNFNQNAMEYIKEDERNIMTSVTLKKWFEEFERNNPI